MNIISISGEITQAPQFTHQCKDEKFYSFITSPVRLSGTKDDILCSISEKLLPGIELGDYVLIEGELRERTVDGHSYYYLIVQRIERLDSTPDEDCNQIFLRGFTCKQSEIRETGISHRTILETMIASNRESGNKADYIPCLFWSKNAYRLRELPIGTEIELVGRLQSRKHPMWLENGELSEKTVYEVSVTKFEEVLHEN